MAIQVAGVLSQIEFVGDIAYLTVEVASLYGDEAVKFPTTADDARAFAECFGRDVEFELRPAPAKPVESADGQVIGSLAELAKGLTLRGTGTLEGK